MGPMHVIEVNNIREALPQAVDYLMNFGVREQTRLGEGLAAPSPVTIRYHYPKQHVLLNPIRDTNPFFHLMEAMWMLAGRQDGAFLDHYIKDFSKRFGNGGIIIDAYGYRWRYGLMFDQLDEIVSQLSKDPTTRQCALQMWGAHVVPDLLSKFAKPCNLVATFRIWNEKLDLTVFNRSNDLIWGCCGANAVHFPILQEYIAGKLGREIGEYWQISTNLHLYKEHIKMMAKRIGSKDGPLCDHLRDKGVYERTQPLVTHPSDFDEELYETIGWLDDIHQNKEIYRGNISNRFLCDTVLPMAQAHQCYKNKDYDNAYQHIAVVTAEDWHEAGKQWLDRRIHEHR
jgi:thymidylate synthase